MVLIADSGSTNTEWALLNGGAVENTVITKGFNPFYYKEDAFVADLQSSLQGHFPFDKVAAIYYYGSGCSNKKNCTLVKKGLQAVFRYAHIEVDHDLYAGGLALFGDGKGIACILGTGSNSCLWENNKIIDNVPSLGYMLGDEGSGTHIGKLLLKGILLGEADVKLTKNFYSTFQLDFGKSLDRIYKTPNPNLFYSSLTPFANSNIDNPFCKAVVKESLTQFVQHYISKYPEHQSLPVSFVGSVAFHFQEIIKEVLRENQMTFGHILQHPMEGLVKYHLGNNA